VRAGGHGARLLEGAGELGVVLGPVAGAARNEAEALGEDEAARHLRDEPEAPEADIVHNIAARGELPGQLRGLLRDDGHVLVLRIAVVERRERERAELLVLGAFGEDGPDPALRDRVLAARVRAVRAHVRALKEHLARQLGVRHEVRVQRPELHPRHLPVPSRVRAERLRAPASREARARAEGEDRGLLTVCSPP
jgi:hypothetical protein